jgi:predicted methyltransferase
MNNLASKLFIAVFSLAIASSALSASLDKKIDKLSTAEHRSEHNISRNQYRHPKETLKFFEIKQNMTVVEIWPSSGWYTEILAPLLKKKGKYYAAGFSQDEATSPAWRINSVKTLEEKLSVRPDLYAGVVVTELAPPEKVDIAPAASADRVLTFRNVHNWMKGDYADAVFVAMYKALKPGGLLGVVEHRANEGTSIEDMIKSGYVTEAHVIALAEKAGFKLVARSEVNANAKDTKDHPEGVWTLPPSLRLKEQDKEKYLAIGESDRMTLKFVKPK